MPDRKLRKLTKRVKRLEQRVREWEKLADLIAARLSPALTEMAPRSERTHRVPRSDEYGDAAEVPPRPRYNETDAP